MDTCEISAAHENSIRQLITEFGDSSETLVRATYEKQRERLEKEARVHLFAPILACRAAREVLRRTGTFSESL
jgi:hypothetical protein